jgi:uncharacterized membrane protein YbhN (UPF0104 family)
VGGGAPVRARRRLNDKPLTSGGLSPGRVARVVGALVVAMSLLFIGAQLWSHRDWLADWRPDQATLLVVLAGTLFYGLGSLLLSAAWTRLLHWCGEDEARFATCHPVYGRTQIAKYLPGNVFQYLGRQVLGHRAGLSQLGMAAASVYEILAFLLAAGLLGALGIGVLGLATGDLLTPARLGLILLAAAGLLLGATLAAPRAARLAGIDPRRAARGSLLRDLLPAFAAYALFVIMMGLILSALVAVCAGAPSMRELGILVTGFAAAWVAGFVTPGAPGGLGVREAMMLLVLSPMIGDSLALVVALLFRIITVAGDLVFFVSAHWLGNLPAAAGAE